MENTQENPTSQNPTPADETARQAAEAVTPEQEAAASVATDTPATGAEAALAEAQAKIAELQESFLRAKAETENVRRRAQEDVAKAHKFAIESFAEHLLPVIEVWKQPSLTRPTTCRKCAKVSNSRCVSSQARWRKAASSR